MPRQLTLQQALCAVAMGGYERRKLTTLKPNTWINVTGLTGSLPFLTEAFLRSGNVPQEVLGKLAVQQSQLQNTTWDTTRFKYTTAYYNTKYEAKHNPRLQRHDLVEHWNGESWAFSGQCFGRGVVSWGDLKVWSLTRQLIGALLMMRSCQKYASLASLVFFGESELQAGMWSCTLFVVASHTDKLASILWGNEQTLAGIKLCINWMNRRWSQVIWLAFEFEHNFI